MLRHLTTFRNLNDTAPTPTRVTPEVQAEVAGKLYETDLKYPELLGDVLNGSSPVSMKLVTFVIGAMCAEVVSYNPSPVIMRIFSLGYEWGCSNNGRLQAELAELLPQVNSAYDVTPMAHYMGHMQRVIQVAHCLCEAAKALEEGNENKFNLNFSSMFRWYVESVAEKRHFDEFIRRRELVYCNDGTVAWNSNYKAPLFSKPAPSLESYATTVKGELLDFLLMLLQVATVPAHKAA